MNDQYQPLKKLLMDLIIKIKTKRDQIESLINSSGGHYSTFKWFSAKIPGFGLYRADKEMQSLLDEMIVCNR